MNKENKVNRKNSEKSKNGSTRMIGGKKFKVFKVESEEDEGEDLFNFVPKKTENKNQETKQEEEDSKKWDIVLKEESIAPETKKTKKSTKKSNQQKEKKPKKNWSKIQQEQLNFALNNTNPCTKNFWAVIASKVEGKGMEECMKRYQKIVPSPKKRKDNTKKKQTEKKNKKATTEKKKEEGELILKGKVGTIKRKRQIRDLVENSNTSHEDLILIDDEQEEKNELNEENSLEISFDENHLISYKNNMDDGYAELEDEESNNEEKVLIPIDRKDFDLYINRINKKTKKRVTKKMRTHLMKDLQSKAILPKIDVDQSSKLQQEIGGIVAQQERKKQKEMDKDNNLDDEDQDYYFEDEENSN